MMIASDANHCLKLGQDYRRSKDYASAILQLKQALGLSPDHAEIHLELGRVYREMRDFDCAIKELETTIELGLDNNESHLELGRTYREKEDHAKAIQELNAALKYNPNDGRIHLELGRLHQQNKELDSALKELSQAVELGLDNDEVHLALGRAHRDKRQLLQAIEEFKLALKHKPSDARMHLELGWVYHDNEDYELAVGELEEAVSLGIDSEELHISLGRMYRKVGEHQLSVDEFTKAIAKSPNRDDAFFKNKMLNEIEISQKKITLESKPIGLGITLTSRCNLRCRICGVWKEPWDIPGKIIQDIIELMPTLERIVWQGGEVFLLEYFAELFEKAASYPQLKQTIITNGLLIDEKWAQRLARDNVALIYSIDGVTKDVYEDIAGDGAKFEYLIRSINFVNEYRQKHDCHKDPFNKMTTIINMVVMESNYRQLEEFVDFAKEYQFDEMQLVPILGIRGVENIFTNRDQKAKEFLSKVMPRVIEKVQDYGIVFHNWLPLIPGPENNIAQGKGQNDNCSHSSCSGKKNKEVICYLPWQQMFMTPDRKLKPGCYCSLDLGDINKNSLFEIWNSQAMQLYRKKLLDNDYRDLCDSACVSGVIPQKELKVSRYG